MTSSVRISKIPISYSYVRILRSPGVALDLGCESENWSISGHDAAAPEILLLVPWSDFLWYLVDVTAVPLSRIRNSQVGCDVIAK
jgi:hypothetical protein